jgi:hypothetical protein
VLAAAAGLGASGASAQSPAPLELSPNVAGQGTALVLGADEALLAPEGRTPGSIVLGLARGARFDAAARTRRCRPAQAAAARSPEASAIGSGRYVVAVTGFLAPGGRTDLTWSIAAYLGTPVKRGDLASVVLVARLVAADAVAELLPPALATGIPAAATTTGRLVRRRSGAFGLRLSFPAPPVGLAVAPPATATPTRLELALSAVRRVRQDFVRRIRVATPSGTEVRRIRDHRLVGHELLRAPRRCSGSWPYELRIGFADGTRHSAGRFPCATTAF